MPSDEQRTALKQLLDRQPRYPIGLYPTPLQEVPRFSEALGGPRIYLKRDDLTGLGYGGNKARMLDYFIGEAKAQGCDVLIGGGAAFQSNHAMMCAAAARKAGMTPVILARTGTRYYVFQGNYLLTKLLIDGGVYIYSDNPQDAGKRIGSQRVRLMNRLADELRAEGHKPYILPGSTHPLGALGYVECALELAGQCEEMGIKPDWIFLTSTGSGQAGLLLGNAFLGQRSKIVGCAPTPGTSDRVRAERVANLANETADRLGADVCINPEDVVNLDRGGQGYGIVSSEGMEALRLMSRTEGIFLDPVYTSKGVGGLIGEIRKGTVSAQDTVIYIHTGGGPLNFAYSPDLVHEFDLKQEDDHIVADL